jgi:serine/threonine protein kinase
MTVLGVLSGETDLTVRLCDFGQSRRVTEISPSAFSNQRAATRYRAPELSGRNASHTTATDIYAAGIFIFDILALAAMSVEPNTPVPVPRKLWDLCQRCTAKNPEKRPEAIKAVLELENLKDDEYKKEKFDLIDLREALRSHSSASWGVSAESSSGNAVSLLSRESLENSLGSFIAAA